MKNALKIICITGTVLCVLLFGGLSFAIEDFKDFAPIPEPANLLILGVGLIGLARWGRKKIFKK